MSKNQRVFLVMIFLLGFGLRVIRLGEVPANLSQREVELASKVAPVVDYRLGLLRLPFVFGYSLTIPVVVYLLFCCEPKKERLLFRPGVWTGILIAVSPWHLLLSRRADFLLATWRQLSLENIVGRFFSFLSLKYLFLTGDPVFLLTGNSGLLLSVSLIGILVALMAVRRLHQVFWGGLLVVLVGTILATIQPHTVNARALVVALFGWSVFSGWGMAETMRLVEMRRRGWGKLLKILLSLVLFYQGVTSVQNVMVHSKKLSQAQWELVYRPVAEYLLAHQLEYEIVVVSPRYAMPRRYLEWYGRGEVDFSKVVIDRQRDRYARPGVLYVGPIDERESYSVDYQTLKEFGLPTGVKVLFAGVVR